MDRRTLLVGMVSLVLTLAGAGAAHGEEAAPVLDLLEPDPSEGREVEPAVDCSDGRPDRDCLSGRLGADQASQTCNGFVTFFGAGNCSVHCGDGYYACGKCGFGGFAMCTCRANFTCNPYAP